MHYPVIRPRRLREKAYIREMFKETKISLSDLIYPMFVVQGRKIKKPIASMPGIYQYSLDHLLKEVRELVELGIKSIILFGIPQHKDAIASSGYDPQGPVQEAIRVLKSRYHQDLVLITDVCLCEYTDHGHCGLVENERILNDPSLEVLTRIAISHAEAGADMVAPSDMMDGRIKHIRQGLDQSGFSHIPIMAYSAKYASNFYGPFREAAESAPQFGDRRSYQMYTPNSDEALREVALDLEEGADVVMVKPALAYLDIIRRVKDHFNCPIAAYNVSGEYSMVKAAAAQGWLDEPGTVWEMLTGIKRAGADVILTYFAPEVARWMQDRKWPD